MQVKSFDDVRLNRGQLRQNEDMVRHDVHIRSATSMFLDPLLSGGISFRSEQREARLYPQDTDHASWERRVWDHTAREMFYSMWANGFAACVSTPHPLYGMEPRVLELSDYEITLKTDLIGQQEFEYRVPDASGTSGLLSRMMAEPPNHPDADTQDREDPSLLPSVITFVMDAPRRDGTLKSKIMAMYKDYNIEQRIMAMATRAMESRSTPTIVMQHANAPVSTGNVNTTIAGMQRRRELEAPNDFDPTLFGEEAPAEGYAAFINSRQGQIMHSERTLPEHLRTQHRNNTATNEVELERNMVLARHVLPETPTELLHLRLEREKRVYMLFGIPLNMVGDDRKRRSAVGSSGFQAGSQSEDIFMRAQQVARAQLKNWLDALHAFMHGENEMLDFVAQNKEQTQMVPDNASTRSSAKRKHAETAQQADEREFIQNVRKAPSGEKQPGQEAQDLKPFDRTDKHDYWTKFNKFRKQAHIGSQPDEAEVDKLYASGALTYDAYVKSYAQRLGLDVKCFNPKAIVPVTTNPAELPASTRQSATQAASKSKPKKKASSKSKSQSK